jgi:hypothetical protein
MHEETHVVGISPIVKDNYIHISQQVKVSSQAGVPCLGHV